MSHSNLLHDLLAFIVTHSFSQKSFQFGSNKSIFSNKKLKLYDSKLIHNLLSISSNS